MASSFFQALLWAPAFLPSALAFQFQPSFRYFNVPTKVGALYALPPSIKGVIFDMDGTLIQHSIDFADLRRRINAVVDSDPIGQHIERDDFFVMASQLTPAGQEACQCIFADIEQKARDDMKLMPGGAELLQFLQERDMKCAVLTRNREVNVHIMHDMYFSEIMLGKSSEQEGENKEVEESSCTQQLFHTIVARDTKLHENAKEPLKSKPEPDGILHICNLWEHDPSEIIMVGDNANDDIMAANRAGCGGSVLLVPGGKMLDTHSGYHVGDTEEAIRLRTPSLSVESLTELKVHLEELLNEDVDDTMNMEKMNMEKNKTYKPKPGSFVYTTETYSVVIPEIGVKNV